MMMMMTEPAILTIDNCVCARVVEREKGAENVRVVSLLASPFG